MDRSRCITSRLGLALGLLAALASVPAGAQSGAEANAWAKWCRQQGGTVQKTGSNPICVPPAGDPGSAGYTPSQRAMLDLAGQVGSTLGASLRETFAAEARLGEIRRMEREWEAEQARLNALKQIDRQRTRSAELLASMQGTIASSDLGLTRTTSQELRVKTGDEAFETPSNPRGTLRYDAPGHGTVATPPAPPDVGGAPVGPDLAPAVRQAWDDYLAALQRKHAAEQAVLARQNELAASETLAREARRQVDARAASVVAAPPQADPHRSTDPALAEARRLLEEAAALNRQARTDLEQARAEAAQASRALAQAETRRDALARAPAP